MKAELEAEQQDRVRTARWREPVAAAVAVWVCSGIVALTAVIVTAGGRDQRDYHWPTVEHMRAIFPRVDVVDVQTATAPLYHLVMAGISGPLHLSQSCTQFLASSFAAGLAAFAFWYTRSVRPAALRLLAVGPLVLSPYFWQSALWMLNDAAALLFAFLAIAMLLGQSGRSVGRDVVIGVLIAAAIATRQSYVWLVVPAALSTIHAMRGDDRTAKLWACVRVCLPGLAVLTVLVVLWHGMAPPDFQRMNVGSRSWESLSYGFAVAAMFFVPILVAIAKRPGLRPLPLGLAVVAALPALIFPSSATLPPDDARRGGFIWSFVSHGPVVADRSLLLAALAFGGAWAVYLVLTELDRHTAIIVGSALIAHALESSAAGRLYQKYFDLPTAALALVTIVAFAVSARVRRRWPLLALAALQAALTAAIVVKPYLEAL